MSSHSKTPAQPPPQLQPTEGEHQQPCRPLFCAPNWRRPLRPRLPGSSQSDLAQHLREPRGLSRSHPVLEQTCHYCSGWLGTDTSQRLRITGCTCRAQAKQLCFISQQQEEEEEIPPDSLQTSPSDPPPPAPVQTPGLPTGTSTKHIPATQKGCKHGTPHLRQGQETSHKEHVHPLWGSVGKPRAGRQKEATLTHPPTWGCPRQRPAGKGLRTEQPCKTQQGTRPVQHPRRDQQQQPTWRLFHCTLMARGLQQKETGGGVLIHIYWTLPSARFLKNLKSNTSMLFFWGGGGNPIFWHHYTLWDHYSQWKIYLGASRGLGRLGGGV